MQPNQVIPQPIYANIQDFKQPTVEQGTADKIVGMRQSTALRQRPRRPLSFASTDETSAFLSMALDGSHASSAVIRDDDEGKCMSFLFLLTSHVLNPFILKAYAFCSECVIGFWFILFISVFLLGSDTIIGECIEQMEQFSYELDRYCSRGSSKCSSVADVSSWAEPTCSSDFGSVNSYCTLPRSIRNSADGQILTNRRVHPPQLMSLSSALQGARLFYFTLLFYFLLHENFGFQMGFFPPEHLF